MVLFNLLPTFISIFCCVMCIVLGHPYGNYQQEYYTRNSNDGRGSWSAQTGFGMHIINNPNQLQSALGAHAYANSNRFGGSAGANTHIVHMEGSKGVAAYGAGIGRLGVHASGSLYHGLGVGVEATAAEIGGHVGFGKYGPLGIGAKLGLSATTGVKLGPQTSIKVLGSGVGVGKKGFELCFIGNCLYLG